MLVGGPSFTGGVEGRHSAEDPPALRRSPHPLALGGPSGRPATGCGRKYRRTRGHALTLTTLMPQPRTQAAHRSCRPVCAAEAWATVRNALELSGCPRLCAADGGADQRVQGQEQLERPALAARAAGPAQAVNIVADEHCCRCAAVRRCSTGAAMQAHSSCCARLCRSGSAVRT